jgi:hypothetical protein
MLLWNMIDADRVGTQIVPTRQGLFDDGYDEERKCFVGWAGFSAHADLKF